MPISEVWPAAPCEIQEWIGERTKGELQMAWYIGVMHHSDPKKYPKRAEALWEKKSTNDLSTLEDMIAFALTVPEAPATEKS